jgi:hypothetical protein
MKKNVLQWVFVVLKRQYKILQQQREAVLNYYFSYWGILYFLLVFLLQQPVLAKPLSLQLPAIKTNVRCLNLLPLMLAPNPFCM